MNSKKKSGQSNPPPQTDLIWGINTVYETLLHKSRDIGEVLIAKGRGGSKLQEIIELARHHKMRLRFVAPERLGVAGQCNHQGVVARLSQTPLYSLDELLDSLKGSVPAKLLALDSIQDPHNLGAILRSAAAAGFTSVILTRERSAPVSGTVAKVAAGALSRLKIATVTNLAKALEQVKEHGFWVYGSVADVTAPSMYTLAFSAPICLVIGSESKGIRPLVQKQCDQLFTIPMHEGFNSINASVAAGVIMFEVIRQEMQSL